METEEQVPSNDDIVAACSKNLNEILLAAKANAEANERRDVTSEDLLAAFVLRGGGQTGLWLRSLGIVVESLTSRVFLNDGQLNLACWEDPLLSCLEQAAECARTKGHSKLSRSHLVYALLLHKKGDLAWRLQDQGFDPEHLADLIYTSMPSGPMPSSDVRVRAADMTLELIKTLCAAEAEARAVKEDRISERMLVKAWVRDGGGETARFLVKQGVRWSRLL